MIDFLEGTVSHISKKRITVKSSQIGFDINVPNELLFSVGETVKFHIYLNWNQEQGPSLFGFKTRTERDLFFMITSCSKIGPKIALSVLAKMSVTEFLGAVSDGDFRALSKVNGIGEKKAQNIIFQLKDKITKFISLSDIKNNDMHSLKEINRVSATLSSLGYSNREISSSLEHAKKLVNLKDGSFDKFLRAALSYFSKRT